MGPFFWRLRKDLENAGARVSKVNFCAGDTLFYPTKATHYRGTLEKWPEFLSTFIIQHNVDAVFLFGDCRPYHYVIRRVARWLNADLYVFEEGYLRPDYITFERGGVNAHSSIPRAPKLFSCLDKDAKIPVKRAIQVKNAFSRAAWYATCYSITNFLFGWTYPNYRHHRPLNPLHQAYAWIRSLVRKHWFLARESKYLDAFTTTRSGRYFLVPLQVHNDAQLTTHSEFASVEQIVDRIAQSFAAHALPDEALVFKHHPMDRAYRDYGREMAAVARKYNLEGRLYYVHDLHLPTLLKHARGTVVVNSTVGLSSLHHGTPVITLGDPVYNMPGLTYQGSLDSFWQDPGTFDEKVLNGFRHWLLAYNQANGNFYRPLKEAGNHAGVVWPSRAPEALRAKETPLMSDGNARTYPQGDAA